MQAVKAVMVCGEREKTILMSATIHVLNICIALRHDARRRSLGRTPKGSRE